MDIVSKLVEVHVFRMKGRQLQFLLLKRSEMEIYPGLWQMVSGKIRKNEKAYLTALRELKEETGIAPLKLWVAPRVNSFYDAEGDSMNLIPVFAALVNHTADVILSREHTDYKWLSISEAVKRLVWHGQRKSVEIISNYFIKEMNFLNFVEVKITGKRFYCG